MEVNSRADYVRPLGEFLRVLGRSKPQVACVFLEAMDDALSSMLVYLLLGIDESGDDGMVRRFVTGWIADGRFLGLLGEYSRRSTVADVGVLKLQVARAIELKDWEGVVTCVGASADWYAKAADARLIKAVFMPAVDFLTRVGRHDWFYHGGPLYKGSLVAALDEVQSLRLLDSFVKVPRIDFEADAILAVVAVRFPSLVLDFFDTRIQRTPAEGMRYLDQVPDDLHALREPLSAHPDLLIASARRWYRTEPAFHASRGGRLIRAVFPTLGPAIEAPLGAMVGRGGRTDVEFVLATPATYEGVKEVYPLCMDVVDAIEAGNDLLDRVTVVLAQKGMMTGEFGFVEAESEQLTRLERWREDPRPRVQTYVATQMRRIQQSMAWEQRRAERAVGRRLHDWGET